MRPLLVAVLLVAVVLSPRLPHLSSIAALIAGYLLGKYGAKTS